MDLNIIRPWGSNASSCGYCKKEDTFLSVGIKAVQLSSEIYQSLLDRGWRRSGNYCYKPNMKKTCCPQYTIRLDTTKFQPNKTQRKVINKFNKFITGREGKKRKTTASLEELIDEIEDHPDIKFVLEPCKPSQETFELYKKYQMKVHNDNEDEITQEGLSRFLIVSPFFDNELRMSKDLEMGNFNYKYYYKGKLIAMEVMDFLPNCISSVYFMYDPEYHHLSLGKYSALRTIRMIKKLHESSKNLKYYYLGYYIHSCPKMSYKGDYQPSFLLDPDCLKKLNSENTQLNGYSDFTDITIDAEGYQPTPQSVDFPGTLPLSIIDTRMLNKTTGELNGNSLPLGSLCDFLEEEYSLYVTIIKEVFAALGLQSIENFIFKLN